MVLKRPDVCVHYRNGEVVPVLDVQIDPVTGDIDITILATD